MRLPRRGVHAFSRIVQAQGNGRVRTSVLPPSHDTGERRYHVQFTMYSYTCGRKTNGLKAGVPCFGRLGAPQLRSAPRPKSCVSHE